MKRIVLAFALLALICSSCSVMCKKNNIRKYKWVAEYSIFVADAGNETVTATLSFPSAKNYVLETKATMPPYPAMYMNADGSVDTIPGYSREYRETGTYTFKDGLLVLTGDDGTTREMRLLGGMLISEHNDGITPCEFKKSE